jgi:hypothetical protein
MLAKHNNIKKQVIIDTKANIIILNDLDYDRKNNSYDYTETFQAKKEYIIENFKEIDFTNKKKRIDEYRKNILEIANINKTIKTLVHEIIDDILDYYDKEDDYIITIKTQPNISDIFLNKLKL